MGKVSASKMEIEITKVKRKCIDGHIIGIKCVNVSNINRFKGFSRDNNIVIKMVAVCC